MSLDALLQRADIWRGRSHSPSIAYLSSGHPHFDAQWGGWPRAALIELLLDQHGIGELELLAPALRQHLSGERWIAWLTPPHIPYAPALEAQGLSVAQQLWLHPDSDQEALWAAEQLLRSGLFAALLYWPARIDSKALRRLQLACEERDAVAYLFRPRSQINQTSAAAMRLSLTGEAAGLKLSLHKQRGGFRSPTLTLPLRHPDARPLNA